jgi:viologen exporter family transport system ATP-binding protein
VIEADQLSKTFWVHRKEPGLWGSLKSLVLRRKEPKLAVREVSFRIGEGEIVGLVGANGAGKTTVVKMLSGVIHPTSGSARVLGFVPWERDDRFRRQIALIMGQKAQLWWDLPAADCFLLLREIYQVPVDLYRRRLDYLAGLLEVRGELTTQIRRLSLGERMKMELIAALLHAPRTVFLDEPTIGLDLSAQRAIREFILEYRREHRPAMIVTSHYMEDIERLCERILILRHGELVYDGSLASVVERFARHKVVTVHLAPGCEPAATELESLGRVLRCDGPTVSLEVPRERVTEVASALISRLEVADLAITEEPVGSIIERLQRDKGVTP